MPVGNFSNVHYVSCTDRITKVGDYFEDGDRNGEISSHLQAVQFSEKVQRCSTEFRCREEIESVFVDGRMLNRFRAVCEPAGDRCLEPDVIFKKIGTEITETTRYHLACDDDSEHTCEEALLSLTIGKAAQESDVSLLNNACYTYSLGTFTYSSHANAGLPRYDKYGYGVECFAEVVYFGGKL